MGTIMADSISGSDRNYHRKSRRCGKLFFCFNSCFFSSSMKITRSIFSPARHKDHPFSLSSSLTRRLTSNGSLKGAQSPFPFPTNVSSSKKRRGSAALDNNPEPSSPKVTCIGQVRVKSKKKKHARKLRTPSRRRSSSSGGGADESFRRMDNWGSLDLNLNSSSKQTSFTGNSRHRNQRWVHLPLTICEGLKGLGASSCFCFSSSREGESKRGIKSIIRSDLDLEEEEGIEIGREKFEAKLAADAIDHAEEEESEEEGRMNILSVPPKNALLLMRSRSDPMRVAALSRRLLESPLPNCNVDYMNLEDQVTRDDLMIPPVDADVVDVGGGGEINGEEGNEQSEAASVVHIQETLMEDEENQRETEHFEEDDSVMDEEEIEEPEEEEDSEMMGSTMAEEEEEEEKGIYADSLSASEKMIEEDEDLLIEENEEEEEARESVPVRSDSDSDSESDEDLEKESTKEMETVKVKATGERVVGSEAERESHKSDLDRENDTTAESGGDGAISAALPDCLLLMMREPKVSMEVSKETWVCSTDFKRILPERRRPANKTLPDGNGNGNAEEPKNKRVDGSLTLTRPPKPALKQQRQQGQQPARSSCSHRSPISAVPKLPRCKSEPRTAAAKLMPPETCMWKSRKVEQFGRSTVGVGPAAGVGF